MAPNLSPARLIVAAQCVAVGIYAGLVVVLAKQDFADAVTGQRTQRIGVQGFFVLGEPTGKVALSDQLLALQDGDSHLQVGRRLEHPVIGIDSDAPGPTEGIYHVLRVGAHHLDLLILGLAVCLYAQVHRHPEQVEILLNLSDGSEALVVAKPVDGVFVSESRRAGTVNPLCKERGQLLLALRLGYLDQILRANRAVGVLAQSSFKRGQEGLVAHFPAEHVEHHGALFQGHGLELGGKRIQAPGARKRYGVVGQRTGCDVFHRREHRVFAAFIGQVHQLAIAGHSIGDPGIVERAWTDFAAPPLVRDGIGQQPHTALVAYARTRNRNQFRSPDSRQGVVRHLHHIQVARLQLSEVVGEEVELLCRRLCQLVGGGLMAYGQVHLHIAGAHGCGANESPGNHCAGKSRLLPIEVELVARLAAAQGDRFCGSLGTAGKDLHALGHADVHFRRKPVGHVSGGGEPARGVKQISDGLLNGGQLETLDRAIFSASDGALVLEGPAHGLTLHE